MRVALFVVLFVACNGGGSGGTGGGSATGGGTGGTGGGASEEVEVVNAPHIGNVTFTNQCSPGQPCRGSIRAAFADVTGPSGCFRSTLGDCVITDCRAPADGGRSYSVSQSAGTVTISGPHFDGGLTLNPIGSSYGPVQLDGPAFDRDDLLTVSSTGGDVPAFQKSVRAPAAVVISSPPFSDAGFGSASASSNLVVAWTGSGQIQLVIDSDGAGDPVEVVCTLTSSPASIPRLIDLKVGPNGSGYQNSLTVSSSAQATFSAGDYAVTLSAVSRTDGALTVTP